MVASALIKLLPEELRYINEPVNAGLLNNWSEKPSNSTDRNRVVKLIDDLKNLGFWAATISGLSVSVSDNVMIENKDELIDAANKRAEEVQENLQNGSYHR